MATIRMGNVWDRTVDVLQGRTSILASLAGLYFFLPSVISGAVSAWAGTEAGEPAIIARIVGLVASVLLIMGLLAVTAVASDPAVDRQRATRIAAPRLLPALGIILLLALIAVIVFVPVIALAVASGARMTAMGKVDMSQAQGGLMLAAFLYLVVGMILGLIVSAKLAPLMPVIVWERLGLRAVARAWRLTRGSTARLVGVILLYAILVLVAMAAASSITGIVARLILGADADAGVAFAVSVVSAVVSAIATVVQGVFYAQFYVAAAGTPAAVPDAPDVQPGA